MSNPRTIYVCIPKQIGPSTPAEQGSLPGVREAWSQFPRLFRKQESHLYDALHIFAIPSTFESFAIP